MIRIVVLCAMVGFWMVGLGHAAGSEEAAFTAVPNPKLTASKATGHIKVDGRLTEADWVKAAKAGNFCEHYPGDQTKPPVETEAYLTYDEDNLYVAFVCYDDPGAVRASVCERDRIPNDDYIRFCLDTYGDAVSAYVFHVNPYGIQRDAIWASNGGEEIGYDLIWESAGIVTDSGYQVEMAIPFQSLRFSRDEDQVWKVDFCRFRPREVLAEYSWAAYDRDENCWPCQWGTVSGIVGVEPGRGIEIAPTVLGYQSGALHNDGDYPPPGKFVNDDPDGDLSVWVKYGISSNATAEMTLNPDFSQIEADAGQIDVNTTFALFYPERRPFFQEGNDIFRTPIRTLYTRAINDPEFAGKATVRSGGTSVYYLLARDRQSSVYLPSEERSFGLQPGRSTSNILRFRQAVADGSQVGLVFTDQRIENGWSNSTITSDGRIRITPSLRTVYQIGVSHVSESDDAELTASIAGADSLWDKEHTRGLDGESFWGRQGYIGVVWWASNWNASLAYLEATPTFHHYIALIRQNHYRNVASVIGHFIHPESGLFETINPHVRAEFEWNWDGRNKFRQYELCLWTRLRKAQASFYSQYVGRSENFGGRQYDNTWYVYQDATLSLGDPVGLFAGVTYGHRIAKRDNTLGKILDVSLSLDFKPYDRVLLQQWLDYASAVEVESDARLYEGFIWRTRLNYQVSKPLAVRLVVEYDDFYEKWRLDPLLTYRLNPFSVLYAGMTSNYQELEAIDSNGTSSYASRLASRQFFIKLQYLFRL
ncbi:MAG: carbohydrate binding family 9 domain-containing protein [candidate division Zixibacteria bacterium]|nr:carbohydrate binding family 9 domain-containing protein [candidate division Zixibacteria bacterium]